METTKTEAEYKLGALRFLLKCATSLSVLIAILMILFGVAGYRQFHNWRSFMEPGESLLLSPSVMMAVLGAVLMVVSLCGHVGAWMHSSCLVNSYALILITLLLVQLTAVVMAFVLDADIISNLLSIPIADYGSDKKLQAEIDTLQRQQKCCGYNSYMDYLGMKYTDIDDVMLFDDIVWVPSSCCARSPMDGVCATVFIGCSTVFVHIVKWSSSSLGVLGVSVMFVQILAVVIALLLARSIRKANFQQALLEWIMKEQMSENEEEQGYRVL